MNSVSEPTIKTEIPGRNRRRARQFLRIGVLLAVLYLLAAYLFGAGGLAPRGPFSSGTGQSAARNAHEGWNSRRSAQYRTDRHGRRTQ